MLRGRGPRGRDGSLDYVEQYHPALEAGPSREQKRRQWPGSRKAAAAAQACVQSGAERAAAELLKDAAAEEMLWALEGGLRGTQLLLDAACAHGERVVEQLRHPASLDHGEAARAYAYATGEQARRSRMLVGEQQKLQQQLWRARIDLDRQVELTPTQPCARRLGLDKWRAYSLGRRRSLGLRLRSSAHYSNACVVLCFRRWRTDAAAWCRLLELTHEGERRRLHQVLREWSRQRRQLRLAQFLGGGGAQRELRSRVQAWRAAAWRAGLVSERATAGVFRRRDAAWAMLRDAGARTRRRSEAPGAGRAASLARALRRWAAAAEERRSGWIASARSMRRLAAAEYPRSRRATSALRAHLRLWRLRAARADAGVLALQQEDRKLEPERSRFESALQAYRCLADECKAAPVWAALRAPPPVASHAPVAQESKGAAVAPPLPIASIDIIGDEGNAPPKPPRPSWHSPVVAAELPRTPQQSAPPQHWAPPVVPVTYQAAPPVPWYHQYPPLDGGGAPYLPPPPVLYLASAPHLGPQASFHSPHAAALAAPARRYSGYAGYYADIAHGSGVLAYGAGFASGGAVAVSSVGAKHGGYRRWP